MCTVKWIITNYFAMIALTAVGQREPCQVEPTYCSRLRSDECYQNFRECCETCPQYYTGLSGCEYGDKASVCEPYLCTSDGNKAICCLTCSIMSTSSPLMQSNATTQPGVTIPVQLNNTSAVFNATVIPVTKESSGEFFSTSTNNISLTPSTEKTTVQGASSSAQTSKITEKGTSPESGLHTSVSTLVSIISNTEGAQVTDTIIPSFVASSTTDNIGRGSVSSASIQNKSTFSVTSQIKTDETATDFSFPMGSDFTRKQNVVSKTPLFSSSHMTDMSNATTVPPRSTQETYSSITNGQNDSKIVNQTVLTTTQSITVTENKSATSNEVSNEVTSLSTSENLVLGGTPKLETDLHSYTTIDTHSAGGLTSHISGSVTDTTEKLTSKDTRLNEMPTTLSAYTANNVEANGTSTNVTTNDIKSTQMFSPNSSHVSTKTVLQTTSGWSTISETPLMTSFFPETVVEDTTIPAVSKEGSVYPNPENGISTSIMESSVGGNNFPTTDQYSINHTVSPSALDTSGELHITSSIQNQTFLPTEQTRTLSDQTVVVTSQPMTNVQTIPMSVTRGQTTQPLTDSKPPCIDLSINGLSCQQFLAKHGVGLCYIVEQVCCETCQTIRQLSDKDCPYGDRAGWCVKLPRSRCYHQNTTCCTTCSEYKRGPAGCEYGDRAPMFCKTIMPWECYEYPLACCETCSKYTVPHINDCQFGDKTEEKICQRYLSAGCLGTNMQERCCQTCWNIEPP